MSDLTTQNPLLPPEPWYTSSVQRAAVLGVLTGMAAVLIDLLGLPVDVQVVNAKIALAGQLISLAFNGWAIVKRQNSPIQPLTMTRAGAVAKADNAVTTIAAAKLTGQETIIKPEESKV